MNITDYQSMQSVNISMQSVNISKLTSKQLEVLAYRLLNYTMVNYDSLRGHMWQIEENNSFPMPPRLII